MRDDCSFGGVLTGSAQSCEAMLEVSDLFSVTRDGTTTVESCGAILEGSDLSSATGIGGGVESVVTLSAGGWLWLFAALAGVDFVFGIAFTSVLFTFVSEFFLQQLESFSTLFVFASAAAADSSGLESSVAAGKSIQNREWDSRIVVLKNSVVFFFF